ncbi:MAG TPA: alpha/beta hydrolase family protein [Phototrophicaceae bacterium]|nr:alpha/beta hydrolase family protein [Phototrophicaceae bacterium]
MPTTTEGMMSAISTDQNQFRLQQHVETLYEHQPRQLAFHAQSVEEFELWKQALRSKFSELLGIAGKRPPTNPQATLVQTVDRGEYVEEKYALDVGESVVAPMYVLVPKTPAPYKAVLGFHGHDPSVQYILGNYPDEQAKQENLAVDGNWAQELARAGYLVCAVEQRAFGERITDQRRENESRSSCRHLAFDYLLEGRTLIGMRCWDGMVALSYLQNRPDVLQGGFACTGHSGGGTTSLWLSTLDERITVAIPSCYFCSFDASILGMEHCECNYIPHVLEYGEMGDLAALLAPRPVRFINGAADPIFPVAATREQFETVKAAYRLFGAEDRVSLTVHPGEHAYNHAFAQEWLQRWL